MTIAHVADADDPALAPLAPAREPALDPPPQATPVTVDPDTRHRLARALRILAAARRRDESGGTMSPGTP